MPAKSQAQRKFLYATKGAAWVHEHGFDNKGKLPARAKGKAVKKAMPKAMPKKKGKKKAAKKKAKY